MYTALVEKPLGKRPLGRERGKWDDNIKADLRKKGSEYGRWMQLA
jgi:hypothetical protein